MAIEIRMQKPGHELPSLIGVVIPGVLRGFTDFSEDEPTLVLPLIQGSGSAAIYRLGGEVLGPDDTFEITESAFEEATVEALLEVGETHETNIVFGSGQEAQLIFSHFDASRN